MKEEELQQLEEDQIYDIAIIGMSGKFPNSPNLDAYWKNIAEGVECISFFDDDELEIDLPETELKNPAFVKAGGTIDEIEIFRRGFFRNSEPRSRVDGSATTPVFRAFVERF